MSSSVIHTRTRTEWEAGGGRLRPAVSDANSPAAPGATHSCRPWTAAGGLALGKRGLSSGGGPGSLPGSFLIPNPIPPCEAPSCIAMSYHSSTHLGYSFQMPTWNSKRCPTAQGCLYSIPLPKAIHLVNCICLGRGCGCSQMVAFIPHPHTSGCVLRIHTNDLGFFRII